MPVTRETEQGILGDAIKTLFFESFRNAPPRLFDRLVSVVPSGVGRASEKYGWLGPVGKMREHKDRRVPQGLSTHDYTIKNKKWENTLAVEREAIDSDQYGQIRMRVQELAAEALRFKDELVFQQIAAGFTQKCYDGKYLYDTTHVEANVEGCPSQSNKLTSALSASSLRDAIVMMESFTDERGKPLGIVPDLLVVPPALQWTAKELLESVYYPDSTTQANPQKLATNVLKGVLDLAVSPYLTDTSDWFIFSTQSPVRALILQQSDELEFEAVAAGSESAFMTDTYLYGVRERFNVGYGLWQRTVGSSVS